MNTQRQVHPTHTRDDELPAVVVVVYVSCGIFVYELTPRSALTVHVSSSCALRSLKRGGANLLFFIRHPGEKRDVEGSDWLVLS